MTPKLACAQMVLRDLFQIGVTLEMLISKGYLLLASLHIQ